MFWDVESHDARVLRDSMCQIECIPMSLHVLFALFLNLHVILCFTMLGGQEVTIEKMASEAMVEKVSSILCLLAARRGLVLTLGLTSIALVSTHF